MTPQEDLSAILFASARASAHFALTCLEPYQGHLRARSSFVDPTGAVMHWHEFGDLEGPGWAANSIGGAKLLYQWGEYLGNRSIQTQALDLLDHVLEDGFIDPETGFIWPYFDIAHNRFCLNYTHNNAWLCPGSLAKIGTQMLELVRILSEEDAGTGQNGSSTRISRLFQAAGALGEWLHANTPRLPSGWVPRRITFEGQPYDQCPTGGPDAVFDHSADGLFLLELYAGLAAAGQTGFLSPAQALGDAFTLPGGFWGSINHDTYDDHESVAYSVAFRVLRKAAAIVQRPGWRVFAYRSVLPALEPFILREDRNGVATHGLLWMETTWDTAYLWENAEAAHAYLEAWDETGQSVYRDTGLAILRAIANHHHGRMGFLTEGVDWNNHVSERHHVNGDFYGDINYTEPLLNNLHHLGPALFYFQKTGYSAPAEITDQVAIQMMARLNSQMN